MVQSSSELGVQQSRGVGAVMGVSICAEIRWGSVLDEGPLTIPRYPTMVQMEHRNVCGEAIGAKTSLCAVTACVLVKENQKH